MQIQVFPIQVVQDLIQYQVIGVMFRETIWIGPPIVVLLHRQVPVLQAIILQDLVFIFIRRLPVAMEKMLTWKVPVWISQGYQPHKWSSGIICTEQQWGLLQFRFIMEDNGWMFGQKQEIREIHGIKL